MHRPPYSSRHIIRLLLIFFVTASCIGEVIGQGNQAQSYSIIHFVRSGSMAGSGCGSDIILPNQKVFSLGLSTIVQYKIYSEGEVTIAVRIDCPGGQSIPPSTSFRNLTLEVKHGDEYYVLLDKGFAVVEVVQKIDAQKHLDKARITQKQEENIDNPIIKPSLQAKKEGKGQGTCFAITANGYLITNHHCIENAKEITVKGIDGDFSTKYGATLIASDPSNDLALIRIENKNVTFKAIPFAIRSSGVQQAEKVYAIGFPYAEAMGKEVKLTDGIISAKSGVNGDISKFQISAAVNPGNSGGPLIDEHGNLVGVIYAKSTLAESAGYAVKASYLETFLKNVDGFEYPTFISTISDKPITDIVAEWKKFVFIVETN